ncbi:MAG TPA: hypothetical protein VFF69_04880 [Phycisphaerales bacterium]|nr:hypothetical protein [Phycisphaerales bacterium]
MPACRCHPHPAHPEGSGGGAELSVGALLRLAADDELTPEQSARVEAHLAAHPEDADRIAFERSLRSACSRACCPQCCAPPGLRERIMVRGRSAPDEQPTGRLGLMRAAARVAAAAALVLLVAVAGYMVGRADPPRDRLVIEPTTGRALAASVAGFVRREHSRCTESGPAIDSKFYVTDPAAVPAEFAAIVGKAVAFPTVAQAEERGLEFVDAGLCHPPSGEAMHVRFRTAAGQPVSLWVQLDDGSLGIEDGVTYTMGAGENCVRFWRVDGVRYILVCPDEQAAPIATLALAMPTPVRSF